jgi:hypothetical protein
MYGMRALSIVTVGLSLLAGVFARSPESERTPSLVSSPPLPLFVRTDADVDRVAVAIDQGCRGGGPQSIVRIDAGCPGTGDLDATFRGPVIRLVASQLPGQVRSFFVYGPPAGQPVPFYDGLLCANFGRLLLTPTSLTSLSGVTTFTGIMQPNPGQAVLSVQCLYRNPMGTYGMNLTDALLVQF